MSKVIPIFRIFDYDKAIEFYIDWLGFTLEKTHTFGENFPLYLMVKLRDIEIHLSEHHGDGSPNARLLIEDFEHIRDYQKLLADKDYKYLKPGLEEAFYNPEILTFHAIDPFGNTLIFTGPK